MSFFPAIRLRQRQTTEYAMCIHVSEQRVNAIFCASFGCTYVRSHNFVFQRYVYTSYIPTFVLVRCSLASESKARSFFHQSFDPALLFLNI